MILKNIDNTTPSHRKYDATNKYFALNLQNCVKTIPQRIVNYKKNNLIENLKFFVNNKKNCSILLFFLFFSKNYCLTDLTSDNYLQNNEIIPYIFHQYNEYEIFKNNILAKNYRCLEKFFLHDESKIIGSILYEDSFFTVDKPILYKILYLFDDEQNMEKIFSIIEKNSNSKIIKALKYIFLNDKTMIYMPIGTKFAIKILKYMQKCNYEKIFIENLIVKLKNENRFRNFIKNKYVQRLFSEIIYIIYGHDFDKSLREKWISLVLLFFKRFSFHFRGNRIIQTILEQEKKYINEENSIFAKIFDELIICDKNIIYYCTDKYASFVIQMLISILYDEKSSEMYKNQIRDFNKVILSNFVKLSLNKQGHFIVMIFLDCERKNVNENDSLIYKILDEGIINDENFYNFCKNKYGYFVIKKVFNILYNQYNNERYISKISDYNKIIFSNFKKLSFHPRGNFLVQNFLEYEKNYIKEYDSLILKLFNELIINNENIIYYRKNKYAFFVIKKLFNIILY